MPIDHRTSEPSTVRAVSAGPAGPDPAATRTTGVRGHSRCRPDCDLVAFDPRHLLPGRRPDGPAAWPGLLAAAAATAVAFGVSRLVPSVNPSTVAVLLGCLVANVGLHRPVLRHGTHVAAHRLLRIAVVLLGLQLALPQLAALGLRGLLVVLTTVVITFVGTQLLGRLLGLSRSRSLLVATGFSICGASAIAAMSDVVPAGRDERGSDDPRDDVPVAVALVTLCGSLAIVVLPLLRVPLGLDPSAFGSWVGASVHDVGQTVATADRVPGALGAAVVVKLSRVVLLAPLVGLVALRARRSRTAAGEDRSAATGRRTPVVPLFVLGFVVCILLRSTGLLPARALAVAASAQQVVLVAALFGLGTQISGTVLRRAGGRAVLLGLLAWVLVASTAYLGVRLTAGS